MSEWVRRVTEQASLFGMPGWQVFMLRLALSVVAVLGFDAIRALAAIPLPKPTDPGPNPATDDAPHAPTAADSSWQTDPEHPGGDNVGGA